MRDRLPRAVPVIRALVEMQPADIMLCSPEREIHEPEGIAEDVGLAISALTCDTVCFAESVGVA